MIPMEEDDTILQQVISAVDKFEIPKKRVVRQDRTISVGSIELEKQAAASRASSFSAAKRTPLPMGQTSTVASLPSSNHQTVSSFFSAAATAIATPDPAKQAPRIAPWAPHRNVSLAQPHSKRVYPPLLLRTRSTPSVDSKEREEQKITGFKRKRGSVEPSSNATLHYSL